MKVDETNLSPRQPQRPAMQPATPGKNTYSMANYLPDTPYIDEKKDSDDNIIDLGENQKGSKKGQQEAVSVRACCSDGATKSYRN